MNKFSQGDIAVITDYGGQGTIVKIENWRGGRVAPYVCRILKSTTSNYRVGEITYKSGRDMELKVMNGKKKVWCCVDGCTTTSFESKGTVLWRCYAHIDCGDAPDCTDQVSLEQKVDLIMAHLGLEVVTKPAEVTLAEKPKNDG